MGIKHSLDLVKKLKNIEEYKKLFDKTYGQITYENIIDAIVEFEKALTTPNSRFDKYLRGDTNALSKDEKKGYEYFKSLGCISCHNGVLLGGNFYQKVGIFENYDLGKNLGRYNVTKIEEDKYYFKVPSLRNISQTAPYFHQGDVKSLRNSIQIMAYYQLGRELENEKRELIYKFLLTLDGEQPRILDEK